MSKKTVLKWDAVYYGRNLLKFRGQLLSVSSVFHPDDGGRRFCRNMCDFLSGHTLHRIQEASKLLQSLPWKPVLSLWSLPLTFTRFHISHIFAAFMLRVMPIKLDVHIFCTCHLYRTYSWVCTAGQCSHARKGCSLKQTILSFSAEMENSQ